MPGHETHTVAGPVESAGERTVTGSVGGRIEIVSARASGQSGGAGNAEMQEVVMGEGAH